MSETTANRAVRFRRGITLPILLLIVWEISSRTGFADPRLGFSLMRNIAGFLIGGVAGVVFASVQALSRTADRLITPTFNGLKQISLLAWIPLISVWFGFGEQAKIVFVALAAFIPIVLNTYEGMRNAPADLIEVGHALRFNARQRVFRIFLPSAMPSIATGVHLGLIYAWLATVGAEYFLAVGPGIGGLVIAGRERFDMALVTVGVFILGFIGFLLNRLASALEDRLLRWRPKSAHTY